MSGHILIVTKWAFLFCQDGKAPQFLQSDSLVVYAMQANVFSFLFHVPLTNLSESKGPASDYIFSYNTFALHRVREECSYVTATSMARVQCKAEITTVQHGMSHGLPSYLRFRNMDYGYSSHLLAYLLCKTQFDFSQPILGLLHTKGKLSLFISSSQ